MNIIEAHKFSSDHKKDVESSTECGCFFCLKTCKPSDIVEWVGAKGDTALCPHCGIDSLLPNSKVNYNELILAYMQKYWFTP